MALELTNRHGVYPVSTDGLVHAGAYTAALRDGQLSVSALCGAVTFSLATDGREPTCEACAEMASGWQLPKLCGQCGARPQDQERKVREAWRAAQSQLCPRCLNKWHEAHHPSAQLPRCPCCARKVHTLHGGVCGDCKAMGLSAPSLFGDET